MNAYSNFRAKVNGLIKGIFTGEIYGGKRVYAEQVITPRPETILTGQKVIVATGTAVPMGNGLLLNGVCVTAYPDNTDVITVGGPDITAIIDGTGNGYRLQPGQSQVFAVDDLSRLYINGTAGDSADFAGN